MGRRQDVEPDDLVALLAENPHQRLTEVTRAAGDKDSHATRHIRTGCW
jgi:hypothetical protein